jgi:hypothetical protein
MIEHEHAVRLDNCVQSMSENKQGGQSSSLSLSFHDVRDRQNSDITKQGSPNDLLDRSVRVQIDGRRCYEWVPSARFGRERVQRTFIQHEYLGLSHTARQRRALSGPTRQAAHLSQQRPCKTQQLPLSSRQR